MGRQSPLLHGGRKQEDLELHIQRALALIALVPEVRKRRRIALWAQGLRQAEWSQGLRRHDPGRDGGGEIFGQKRTQRLVFPGLNVARGPVVEKAIAGDVAGSFANCDRFAEGVAWPDPNAELQLVIQSTRRLENRHVGIGRFALAVRATHRRAGRPNGRNAAVIADRNIFVVWQQRIVGTQLLAGINRVVNAGKEVGVIANLRRHVYGARIGWAQVRLELALLGRAGRQQLNQPPPQRVARGRAKRKQWIERGAGSRLRGTRCLSWKKTARSGGAKINDAVDLGGEPKPTLLWHPAVGIIEMLIEYRARDHWTASFNRNGGCGSAGPRAARGSFAAAPTHSSRRHRPSRRPRACRSRTSTSPAPPTRTDTSNTACRDKCTAPARSALAVARATQAQPQRGPLEPGLPRPRLRVQTGAASKRSCEHARPLGVFCKLPNFGDSTRQIASRLEFVACNTQVPARGTHFNGAAGEKVEHRRNDPREVRAGKRLRPAAERLAASATVGCGFLGRQGQQMLGGYSRLPRRHWLQPIIRRACVLRAARKGLFGTFDDAALTGCTAHQDEDNRPRNGHSLQPMLGLGEVPASLEYLAQQVVGRGESDVPGT